MTDWTESRIATLRRLWSLGWTAGQIAAELGGGLTRSAVIGKARRIGCTSRPSPIKHRAEYDKYRAPRKPERPKSRSAVKGGIKAAIAKAGKAAEQPVAQQNGHVAAQPAARRVGVTPIRSCAWPVGDPKAAGFHFCGAEPVVLGKPYCEVHCRQAYRAPEAKAESEAA